jgi:nitrate/TMAO reductase-like tetraheme cytochrome c subunit
MSRLGRVALATCLLGASLIRGEGFGMFQVCVLHRCQWMVGVAALASGCVGEITGDEPPALAREQVPARPEPALELSEFTSEQTCRACHQRQADEWSKSAHAHAMRDPVFQALVTRAGAEAPDTRAFCLSCHSNVGSAARAFDADYTFATMPEVVMEGVTCESCHRVQSVRSSVGNAGHELDPTGPMQGSIYAGDTSPMHDTVKSQVLGAAELCGSCHDVRAGGLALEQPYEEWASGPARDDGQVCIDCHMPGGYGQSVTSFGLEPRPIRRHTFLGPGALMWLSELPEPEARDVRREVEEQLARSLRIELAAPAAALGAARTTLRVRLENTVRGHRFPTGSAFFRELWVRLRVSDATGWVVFDSGDASIRGELEPSELWLSARLLDEGGQPTLYPWQAVAIESHSLAPLERRAIDVPLDVPAGVVGPLRAEASLVFQSFPSALLAELGLPEELASRLDLSSASALIAVPESPPSAAELALPDPG